MPNHIIKDTVGRYGNDVQIDAGGGDHLSLVRRGGQDTDIHNYNYTVIADKISSAATDITGLTSDLADVTADKSPINLPCSILSLRSRKITTIS